MKKTIIAILSFLAAGITTLAQTCWTIDGHAITMDPSSIELPYSDHIEMSGEQVSSVLRWNLDKDGKFSVERSLVFPMLRRIPNNTHASLLYRMNPDIMAMVGINTLVPRQLRTSRVTIDGSLQTVCEYAIGSSDNPVAEVSTTIFPSTTLPMLCETYTIINKADRALAIMVPQYTQKVLTPAEAGVDGSYVIRADIFNNGTFSIAPGESVEFQVAFQAYRESCEQMIVPDVNAELAARKDFLSSWIDSSLILETPEKDIDTEFRFAKIRASESIYRTKGGLMHGPGGESYYAALWCNDECEYVSPFYPYLGYPTGNESALNCYRHYARFMNDEYKPIPSSIIAEGIDIWNGAGDRGDAAMVAHGASRYLLARGSREEAKEIWPFIKWCLEYCRRQLNADGVPQSDSDELEGRFPSGSANLSTACLYYDGLLSAACLAPLMDEPSSVGKTYEKQAKALRKAIGNYFEANVSGFDTYRYYDGNDLLRSWICLPLCFGIEDRAEGTLAALFSDKMMTRDGILTQEGSTTFWDRSTLYALRGAFAAGHADEALAQLLPYSHRRLLETHVPYPIEAWPEGSQRHLSGESGLYCRVVIEGLFGIRPTGFDSFDIKVQMPSSWDKMSLRHVKAFGNYFDIVATRMDKGKIKICVSHDGKTKELIVEGGQKKNIKLR